MKNLIALLVVVFLTTAGFAQDNKMQTKSETKTTSKMSHECYQMKNGALIHCMGEKEEAQKKEVKLSEELKIREIAALLLREAAMVLQST